VDSPVTVGTGPPVVLCTGPAVDVRPGADAGRTRSSELNAGNPRGARPIRSVLVTAPSSPDSGAATPLNVCWRSIARLSIVPVTGHYVPSMRLLVLISGISPR